MSREHLRPLAIQISEMATSAEATIHRRPRRIDIGPGLADRIRKAGGEQTLKESADFPGYFSVDVELILSAAGL